MMTGRSIRHLTAAMKDQDVPIMERGFLQRAGKEVMSWFGDEEAARRREMDHR